MKPLTRFRSLTQAIKEARKQGFATEWIARADGWLELHSKKKLAPDHVECLGYFVVGDDTTSVHAHLFLLEALSGQKGFAAEISEVHYQPAPSQLLAGNS